MTIIMYDGSRITCNEIYFADNEIIVDDYRAVPIIEVLRIIAE